METKKQKKIAENYHEMMIIHERRKLINRILKRYEKQLKNVLVEELNDIFELNKLMEDKRDKDIYQTTRNWPSGLKKYK